MDRPATCEQLFTGCERAEFMRFSGIALLERAEPPAS